MDTELYEQDNERMNDMVESNEEKKYELTDETMEWHGHTLHRIRALKDLSTSRPGPFGVVKTGELGGWVESEDNLSQEGNCWVGEEAKVCGYAVVYGDARVFGHAVIGGNAKVFENAWVYQSAEVHGDAQVFGDTEVFGYSVVDGSAMVYEDAVVDGDAKIREDAKVFGNARVLGDAEISGDAHICCKAICNRDVSTGSITGYEKYVEPYDDEDLDYFPNTTTYESVNPSKKDLLFIESIAKLGLNKTQMEAVMRIHDIAYSEKSLNEGKLSNAIGAGLIGAASLLSPANAQNINDNWVDYVGDDSDSLTTEQVQERNKEMADRYMKSVINTKSWNEVGTPAVNDNPVNSGEYENTLRPIKDLDDAIDHMNEELDRHIDMNIDIDEQLKVNDKENFSDGLDRWSDELLENLKKLAVESGDDMEHLNTFGIGYTKNGDKADAEELAIKDAIKTFKDRASVPEGYKLVLYPDVAKFVLSLPAGNDRWYERSVVGVIVHLVSDDEYEDVPEHLRIGDLKPTF